MIQKQPLQHLALFFLSLILPHICFMLQASSRFGVPRPSENETDAEDAIYSRIRGGQNSRSSLNLPPNESGADTDGGVYERLKFDRQGSDLFSTKDDIDAILKSDRNRASQPQKDPSGPVYDFAAKKEPIYSRVTKVRS